MSGAPGPFLYNSNNSLERSEFPYPKEEMEYTSLTIYVTHYNYLYKYHFYFVLFCFIILFCSGVGKQLFVSVLWRAACVLWKGVLELH